MDVLNHSDTEHVFYEIIPYLFYSHDKKFDMYLVQKMLKRLNDVPPTFRRQESTDCMIVTIS